MYNFLLIILCLVLTDTSMAEAEKERIVLKSRKTTTKVWPIGGAVIFDSTEDFDHMPGNNSYGFFIKDISPDQSICRYKAKVYCDFGLGTTKSIKNKELKLEFIGGHVLGRTDPDGEMDIIFKCNSTFKKKAVTFVLGNYRKMFSPENFPKNIELTPNECKQTN